ncbi:ATPase [Thermus scotoductus]|jgi:hypothetical protein|uniref:ATPase n=1 Tax=Thermus scotoductus TaxID=37636 RepID=UPI001FD0749D|nr:ATPase [Thermus scotoductus]
MKRKRLSELVREEIASQETTPPEVAPPGVASPPGEHPGDLAAPSPGERVPPYLTYVRKECRLRPDQLDALTALARRLNRERRGRGERITENTLLRLAADLLLSLGEEEVARLLEKGGAGAGDSF